MARMQLVWTQLCRFFYIWQVFAKAVCQSSRCFPYVDLLAQRVGYAIYDISGDVCKVSRSISWERCLPEARGGDSYMKPMGMLVVSLRGVNLGFWSRLGCSGQSANILSRQGLVQGSAKTHRITRRETEVKFSSLFLFSLLSGLFQGVKICLSHTQIGLLQGLNSKFPTSIPVCFIWESPPRVAAGIKDIFSPCNGHGNGYDLLQLLPSISDGSLISQAVRRRALNQTRFVFHCSHKQ